MAYTFLVAMQGISHITTIYRTNLLFSDSFYTETYEALKIIGLG